MFTAGALGEGREVDIEFHSYRLASNLPVGATEPAHSYIHRETGSTEAEVTVMLNRMKPLGRRVGIEYNWELVQVTNTELAHQLIHHAKGVGKQIEAEEALFAAHFTQGRNVGDVAVLADVADEIGLDRAEAVKTLTENEYVAAARADIEQAGSYGIKGVPFFVVDGKYGLSGPRRPPCSNARSSRHGQRR